MTQRTPDTPAQPGRAADASSSGVQVSETARVVAALIPSLPPATVKDLARLIQRRLTMLDPRLDRYARLGLLIDIVSVGTGEVPPTYGYEDERRLRTEAGETWPAQSSLSEAYGGWVRAVKAAMYLAFDGSSSKQPATHHNRLAPGRRCRPTYSHGEATAALNMCADTLGLWPTEYEYDDWRRLSGDLARRAGRPAPRFPSRPSWIRLFGSWQAFEEAALRARPATVAEHSSS